MSSQPGKRTIPIQVLPNISRSKGNQTIKFDKFIEYHMRDIPGLFSKKSKFIISLD